ncbi:hypothetical protein Tco_0439316 [Tanacetum coccineum]
MVGPGQDRVYQGFGHSPRLTLQREIRQFLGLAGFIIGRFIEAFLKIAKSMTKLTQKGIKFDWGEKEENAFQLISTKLCQCPIMAFPEGSDDFVDINVMRHTKALVRVLMQRYEVIAYASRTVKKGKQTILRSSDRTETENIVKARRRRIDPKDIPKERRNRVLKGHYAYTAGVGYLAMDDLEIRVYA